MKGPITGEYELRQWHAFSYRGHDYLVNLERPCFGRVTSVFLELLRTLRTNPSKVPSPEELAPLKRLDLLVPLRPGDSSPRQRNQPTAAESPSPSTVPISQVNLMISQECNMRCIYCYGGGGEYNSRGRMDRRTAFRAVDWLIEQAGGSQDRLTITLFGGEPLLNMPLVKELVLYGEKEAVRADKTLTFGISTNASLVDEETASYLAGTGAFGSVLVGFDGPSAIHGRNRPFRGGTSSYETVVTNLYRMQTLIPSRLNLRATIWKSADFPSVVRYFLDSPFLSFQTVFASPSFHQEGLRRSPEITEACVDFIRGTVDEFVEAARRHDNQGLRRLIRWLDFRSVLNRMVRPTRKMRFSCGVGQRLVAIASNGDVYPCHRFVGMTDHSIGNIFSPGLDRDTFLDLPTFRMEPCKSCWAARYCIGGCLYNNLANNGSLFEPAETYCALVKEWTRAGMYIAGELDEATKDFLVESCIVQPSPCPIDL